MRQKEKQVDIRKIKISIISDDTIVYKENPGEVDRILQKLSKFSSVAEHKVTIQKPANHSFEYEILYIL